MFADVSSNRRLALIFVAAAAEARRHKLVDGQFEIEPVGRVIVVLRAQTVSFVNVFALAIFLFLQQLEGLGELEVTERCSHYGVDHSEDEEDGL